MDFVLRSLRKAMGGLPHLFERQWGKSKGEEEPSWT